jgi:hypothetical protein
MCHNRAPTPPRPAPLPPLITFLFCFLPPGARGGSGSLCSSPQNQLSISDAFNWLCVLLLGRTGIRRRGHRKRTNGHVPPPQQPLASRGAAASARDHRGAAVGHWSLAQTPFVRSSCIAPDSMKGLQRGPSGSTRHLPAVGRPGTGTCSGPFWGPFPGGCGWARLPPPPPPPYPARQPASHPHPHPRPAAGFGLLPLPFAAIGISEYPFRLEVRNARPYMRAHACYTEMACWCCQFVAT